MKFLSLILITFSSLAIAKSTAQLDSLLNYLDENGKFSGQVCLSESKNKLQKFSYGFADSNKSKITNQTKFRIGSISKIYTSVLVLKMIEEGQLELGDPLSKFYPQFINAEGIPIKMLLNHYSGIHNFTSDPDYPTWMEKEQSKENLLKRIEVKGVNFEPGAKFEYSNSNYVILSYILEDVSGMSFSQLLEKYITKPLKLKNTYIGKGLKTDYNEADSYTISDGKYQSLPQTHPSVPLGAGAIVSTPEELIVFINALFEGKIISKEMLTKMLPEGDKGYGLGISKIQYDDKIFYGHNGGIDGYIANLSFHPESKDGFAICTNSPGYSLNELMIASYRSMNGVEIQFPSFEEYELSEIQKKRYTGIFTSPDLPLDLTIAATPSGLSAQGTGQPAFDLMIKSETEFTYDMIKLKIVFDEQDSDKWNNFTLIQYGQEYKFSRQK